MKNSSTKSSGNVFLDLGFPEEEAALLRIRADLMISIEKVIKARHWTQVEAAEVLGISQARVSDLVRGKWEKFSIDMLLSLAGRLGMEPKIQLKNAA